MGNNVEKISQDTYRINANGKTYVGKLAEETTSSTTTTSSSSSTARPSLFINPSMYQTSGDTWSYDTAWMGRTLSYPSTPMSVKNDKDVWDFANQVDNMPGQLGALGSQLYSITQMFQANTMQNLMNLFNNISSGTTTTTGGGTVPKEDKLSDSSKKIEALEEKLKKLQKELEDKYTVKSYRDKLKDKTVFDSNVIDISEKLRNGMKGVNLSSWFGTTGDDKVVNDALNDVNEKNVVEVMDYYKSEFCDKGLMGNDYNLIESIYDDFTDNWTGTKYSPKINLLRDAFANRAQGLIDKYGEKAGITEEEIAQFQAAVSKNKDADGYHITGDSTPIARTFEDFKNRIKDIEGSMEKSTVKKKDDADKDETTTKKKDKKTETTSTVDKNEDDKKDVDKDKKDKKTE